LAIVTAATAGEHCHEHASGRRDYLQMPTCEICRDFICWRRHTPCMCPVMYARVSPIMHAFACMHAPRRLSPHRITTSYSHTRCDHAGIGLGIARRLAQEGAAVMISSRKQQNVDETVAALRQEGLNVRGVACHVGSLDQVQHLIKVGRCEGLFPRCVGACEGIIARPRQQVSGCKHQ